jgi:hypothetical protein
MTNDPEFRAAVLLLSRAHVALLWAAADLSKTLPAEIVGDGPFLALCNALDAESDALRALAAHIEPPNIRAELYRAIAEALEGRP